MSFKKGDYIRTKYPYCGECFYKIESINPYKLLPMYGKYNFTTKNTNYHIIESVYSLENYEYATHFDIVKCFIIGLWNRLFNA